MQVRSSRIRKVSETYELNSHGSIKMKIQYTLNDSEKVGGSKCDNWQKRRLPPCINVGKLNQHSNTAKRKCTYIYAGNFGRTILLLSYIPTLKVDCYSLDSRWFEEIGRNFCCIYESWPKQQLLMCPYTFLSVCSWAGSASCTSFPEEPEDQKMPL